MKHKVIIFVDPETGKDIPIELKYDEPKPKREYIVTHNTWDAVESLGVTRHHEDLSVHFDYVKAESYNQERMIYSSWNDIF